MKRRIAVLKLNGHHCYVISLKTRVTAMMLLSLPASFILFKFVEDSCLATIDSCQCSMLQVCVSLLSQLLQLDVIIKTSCTSDICSLGHYQLLYHSLFLVLWNSIPVSPHPAVPFQLFVCTIPLSFKLQGLLQCFVFKLLMGYMFLFLDCLYYGLFC